MYCFYKLKAEDGDYAIRNDRNLQNIKLYHILSHLRQIKNSIFSSNKLRTLSLSLIFVATTSVSNQYPQLCQARGSPF